ICLPSERTSEPELEILAIKLGCVLGTSSQSESYTSTPSGWKSALVVTMNTPGPESTLSPTEYTSLSYHHYPLNNYPHNSESVVQAYQLGALGLTKSLVDCWMMGKLKHDLLMTLDKQLMLEMLGDESLEMIVDESLDMIKDGSLDMIEDESLMVEDKSLEKLVNESLKLDEEHFESVIADSESDSLPHAHAQTTKTYYKHQDSRIKKAQELKTKTSANSDIKDNSSETKLWGKLLESFQEDAKYEHVGQDTRWQGGKDDQDIQGKDLEISKSKTKSKDNDKG
ncbi:hypothetical protein Tco_0284764, partial [Tanacetum coccineum]